MLCTSIGRIDCSLNLIQSRLTEALLFAYYLEILSQWNGCRTLSIVCAVPTVYKTIKASNQTNRESLLEVTYNRLALGISPLEPITSKEEVSVRTQSGIDPESPPYNGRTEKVS